MTQIIHVLRDDARAGTAESRIRPGNYPTRKGLARPVGPEVISERFQSGH